MKGSTIVYITIYIYYHKLYCILGPSLPNGNPFNSSTTSCAVSHTMRRQNSLDNQQLSLSEHTIIIREIMKQKTSDFQILKNYNY